MIRLDAEKSVHFCDGLKRRDFLHAGSLAFLGFTVNQFLQLKAFGAIDPKKDVNCIRFLVGGGQSQLDTLNMKTDDPAEIRGPYKSIATNVAVIQISEIFPRRAKHAVKFFFFSSRRRHTRSDRDWSSD